MLSLSLFSARRTRVLLCLLAGAVSWWMLAGVAEAALQNTTPPSITGRAQQGQVLTLHQGVWTDITTTIPVPKITVKDQWESCTSATACTPISPAPAGTYTTTAGDVGHTIEVVETATAIDGSGGPVRVHAGPVSATSATSLFVSASGPLTNQVVTLVATVSSSSPNASPSGRLTFQNGSTAIGGCANEGVQSSGQIATLICQGSFAAGVADLTAVYTPGPGSLVGASASPLMTLHVGRDSTSTSLAVTKQVRRGSRATYKATVVLPVSNSGPIEPTGSMEFFDRGRPIKGCLNQPLSQLTASCTVRYTRLGVHSISAAYTGDSNFASSTSPSQSVRIVKGSSGPVVLGFVSSTLQWRFFFHPAYTQVAMLRADGLVPGMTVALRCQGARCPFGHISIRIRTDSSMNLLPRFRKRHLRVGSQITVRMTRPHWIGKFYSFTVRGGKGPHIVLSCLGVGRTRPGVGC